MVKMLPGFIELRRDQVSESWLFTCRACGVKEHYDKYWPAARAAHDHADTELAEQDEKRAGS